MSCIFGIFLQLCNFRIISRSIQSHTYFYSDFGKFAICKIFLPEYYRAVLNELESCHAPFFSQLYLTEVKVKTSRSG